MDKRWMVAAALAIAGCGSGGSSPTAVGSSGTFSDSFSGTVLGVGWPGVTGTPIIDQANGSPAPSLSFAFPQGSVMSDGYDSRGGMTISLDAGFVSQPSISEGGGIDVITGSPYAGVLFNLNPVRPQVGFTSPGSAPDGLTGPRILPSTDYTDLPAFVKSGFHHYRVRIGADGMMTASVDNTDMGGIGLGSAPTLVKITLGDSFTNASAGQPTLRFDNVAITRP